VVTAAGCAGDGKRLELRVHGEPEKGGRCGETWKRHDATFFSPISSPRGLQRMARASTGTREEDETRGET